MVILRPFRLLSRSILSTLLVAGLAGEREAEKEAVLACSRVLADEHPDDPVSV